MNGANVHPHPEPPMDAAAIIARWHAHLDARGEPLDDAELAATLAERPDLLAELAQLRADAAVLAFGPGSAGVGAGSTQVAAGLGRWRGLALLATGAAAAAAIVVAGWPRSTDEPPRGPRVIAARFDELRPREWAAATFTITEPLVRTPTTHLETWQSRSERR